MIEKMKFGFNKIKRTIYFATIDFVCSKILRMSPVTVTKNFSNGHSEHPGYFSNEANGMYVQVEVNLGSQQPQPIKAYTQMQNNHVH